MCKKVFSFVFVVYAVALSSCTRLSSSKSPQGALGGHFQVSNNGAATYQIPLQLPPGTNHYQPQLSMVYSSQQHDSIMGLGWSLSGISAISRCPRTVAQDGVMGGINFDGNDRFCISGERLVAINGVYGADGTEYRRERETWQHYISHGSCGVGPCFFTQASHTGATAEFGNTQDSRILAQNRSDVLIWSVNKQASKNNNFTTFSYQNVSDQ